MVRIIKFLRSKKILVKHFFISSCILRNQCDFCCCKVADNLLIDGSYFVNLSVTHALLISSVSLFLLSDLIKFIVENSCSQEYVDPNNVRRAIPSDFIDLKQIGREFHTFRISFSELLVAFSFIIPMTLEVRQTTLSPHKVHNAFPLRSMAPNNFAHSQ